MMPSTGVPLLLLSSIFSLLTSHVAIAQMTPSSGSCGSSRVAIGSFTPGGEGVTMLNLTLCSTSQGAVSGTLVQESVIPVTETGENPSYCDRYNASAIICNTVVDGTASATILSLTEPSTAIGGPFDLKTSKPVHIDVLSNGIVAVASYSGSSFLTFDPSSGAADSVISSITVPDSNATMAAGNPDRQDAPHPHQVLQVAPGELLIPDLGTDAVYEYSVAQDGTLTWVGQTIVPAGSGPRHVAAGPNGKVYLVAELSVQLIELGRDCAEGAEGAARGVCSIKDITPGALESTFNSGAAVRVSKDQKFVYMSLRVGESTPELGGVVGFTLNIDGSLGALVGTWSSGGQQPRDFNLVDVPGLYEVFVMANRKSDDVVVLNRDEVTGAAGEQLASIAVNKPVSVLAIDEESTPGPVAAGPSMSPADSTVRETGQCPAGEAASDSGECEEVPAPTTSGPAVLEAATPAATPTAAVPSTGAGCTLAAVVAAATSHILVTW